LTLEFCPALYPKEGYGIKFKLPILLKKVSDMYFLTSTDKIRPFLEKRANEIIEKAKNESNGEQVVSKKNIFNKIGHALHALNPEFKKVTFGSNVKDVFKSLGYEKPVVCQSMYIFKQPYIGGEVQPHQDGSYLHVQPLKIAGVWIALEDCTLENGCLSFIPGSHKGNILVLDYSLFKTIFSYNN